MTLHARSAINPDGLLKFPGPVSQGMRAKADEYIFVAGQVALGPDGAVVAPHDMDGQARKVLENIDILLKEAGADWDNIVDFTTYIVGSQHMTAFMQVRNELFPTYFKSGVYPPNTLIFVSGLFKPELVLEIHVTIGV